MYAPVTTWTRGVNLLRQVPTLSLSDDERFRLASELQLRVFYEGEVITSEGAGARLIFFLEGGTAALALKKRPKPLAEQKEGEAELDVLIEGRHVRGVVLGLAETIEGADRYVPYGVCRRRKRERNNILSLHHIALQ